MLRREVGLPMFVGTALLAAPLAALATLLVATLFRARVARLMRRLGSRDVREMTQLTNRLLDSPAVIDAGSVARRSAQARRTITVYSIAGLVFTLGATATFMTAFQLWPALTLRGAAVVLGTTLVFSTPLPLALVLLRSRRASLMIASALAWLVLLWGLGWTCGDPDGFVYVWTTYAAVPTGFAVVMALRPLRAGGPLLLAAGWLLLLGAQVGLIWAADFAVDELGIRFARQDLAQLPFEQALTESIAQVPRELERFLHSAGKEQKLVTVAHPERGGGAAIRLILRWLAVVVGTTLVCVLLVSWQARRYRRRDASEIRLSLDVLFLLFTVSFSFLVLMSRAEARLWAGVGMVSCFVLYQVICSLGFRVVSAERPPLALVLLRTFGHDRRTQDLLDAVSHRWRTLGPVRLIGGEDATHATLDLHDFYEFIVGRLQDRFDITQQSLARATPDPDGLYRIETYYSHQNEWPCAVQTLMHASTAVLVDLRGFSESNHGCVLELEALAREPHLRSVLIVDETTDEAALERTLRRTCAKPSSVMHAEGSIGPTVEAVLGAILRPAEFRSVEAKQ